MASNPTWQPPPSQQPNPDPNQQQPYYYYPNPSTNATATTTAATVRDPYTPQGGHSATEMVGQYYYGVDANVYATVTDASGNQYYYGAANSNTYSAAAAAAVPQMPSSASNPTAPLHVIPPQWSATYNHKGKRKMKGLKTLKVVQPLHCGVCKIDCNAQEVLNSHKQGKKHKKNLQKLQDVITPKAQKTQSTSKGFERNEPSKNSEGGLKPQPIYCGVCKIYCDTQEVLRKHETGKKHLKNVKKLQAPGTTNSEEKKEAKLNEIIQPAFCQICKISCTSQEVLNIHYVGKKHMKNLKLQGSGTPKHEEAQLMMTNYDNSEQKKRKEVEEDDLESKKRKIPKDGDTESKLRCDTCNIVVNSPIVYNSHITGSKHAAMLKKQQEAAVVEGKQQ